jgi:hypothetical protein
MLDWKYLICNPDPEKCLTKILQKQSVSGILEKFEKAVSFRQKR